MGNTLGLLYWVGIIGVGCLYWFKYSTTSDPYLMRRYKTGFAALFWPVFLGWLYFSQRSRRLNQTSAAEAKRRILGD